MAAKSPIESSTPKTELKAALSDAFGGLFRVLKILDEHPEALGEVKREVASHMTTALKLQLMKIFL